MSLRLSVVITRSLSDATLAVRLPVTCTSPISPESAGGTVSFSAWSGCAAARKRAASRGNSLVFILLAYYSLFVLSDERAALPVAVDAGDGVRLVCQQERAGCG